LAVAFAKRERVNLGLNSDLTFWNIN